MKYAKKMGNTLWLHCDGRTYTIDLGQKPRHSRQHGSTAASDGSIRSPMPGKILKIEVKEGQKVRPGQTVCVIEAMKMEYALKAPFGSVVQKVYKKNGDQILLDEKVLSLEEAK